MKVTDDNSELIEYSKQLDNKLRKQSAIKENEIENIKKNYEKRIEATKLDGEDRYIGTLKRNDELLSGASKDYENKLLNYKNNLANTHLKIENEEKTLRDDLSEKKSSIENQNHADIKEQFAKVTENQESVSTLTKNRLQSIVDKGRAEKLNLESSSRNQMDLLSSGHNQKAISTEREYRQILSNDLRNHQNDINLQRTELKTVMDRNTEKNKRMETEKKNVQNAELSYLDKHQKDMLTQKQNDFKMRYENLAKQHDVILADLTNHFNNDVRKMIEQNADKKRVITSKADDLFYRIETLNPKITETEKELFVSLPVAEHEKENVHLTVRDRGLKMTLTRNYTESMEDQEGGNNRSTKNELYSKNFLSKDLLDSKNVVQKYENGELLFKIQKR